MAKFFTSLRINEDRFRDRFQQLVKTGATSDGGVHRPAFSEAYLEARQWFLDQAVRAGLDTHVDGAGNHSALEVLQVVKDANISSSTTRSISRL